MHGMLTISLKHIEDNELKNLLLIIIVFFLSCCFKLSTFWISTVHEQKAHFVTSSVVMSQK